MTSLAAPAAGVESASPERRAPAMLVIGGRIETVAKCRDAGAKVVYLQHPHRFTERHIPLVHAALLADYTDWAVTRPLARSAREAFSVSGVATLTEPALETAGRVTDLLGLPGNGYAVHRLLRDKLAMRRRQAEAGVGAVAAAAVVERRSLAAFAEAHGYPFIVKPADGVASMGVLKVERPSDLAAAWRHIERVRSEPLSAAAFGTVGVDTFLAEEYLDGPEYSVEAFTFHGRHVVLAVTEKLTLPNFLEVGHAVPARLGEQVHQEVVAATTAFLECAGVGEGPSHTEMRLTPAGPRIVESHTRPGGDRIIELVEAAYGVDLERYTVGWPVGLVPELDRAPVSRQAAATRFVLAEPGTVERIDGLEEVRAEPDAVLVDLTVSPGDEVRPLAWSWDRPGQVVVTAPTTEQAVARAAELAGRIRIVTR